MDAIKIVLMIILGIFAIYIAFRVASLAIAKSWRQVFSCKDCKDEHKHNRKEQ